MRLLVTGGCGFVGSNLLRHLLASSDFDILNLDLLTYSGSLENTRDMDDNHRIRFVQGDIADAEAVDECLSTGIDAILNLAAESHVDRSIVTTAPFLRTNVIGTQVLLDAARRWKISRFVQISTDEVYGDLGPNGLPFVETSPIRPSNPYAASKASGDLLALAAWRTWNLPVVVTRASNNFGPFQHPEKLIPTILHRALSAQPIPLYGLGDQVREWTQVTDHCRGIVAALKFGRPGQVYNLGGGTSMTNIALAKEILRLLDSPTTLLQYVQDRPGHDRRYAMSGAKAEAELGFAHRERFSTALAETVHWYAAHREWLARRVNQETTEPFLGSSGAVGCR